LTKVLAEQLRRGEVNRVQRSQLGGLQYSGCVEHSIIDPYKIQPAQHLTTAGQGDFAGRQQGPQHLSAG
jgi:hypothetical protein